LNNFINIIFFSFFLFVVYNKRRKPIDRLRPSFIRAFSKVSSTSSEQSDSADTTVFSSNISSLQDSLSATASSVLNKINPFESSSSPSANKIVSIAEQRRSTKKQKSFISKLEFNSISSTLFGANNNNSTEDKSLDIEIETSSELNNQNNAQESVEMFAQSGIEIDSKKTAEKGADFSQNGSGKSSFLFPI
jgi:hypothetical protein